MESLQNLLWDIKDGVDPWSVYKFMKNSDLLPQSMKLAKRLQGRCGCINTCSFNPYGEFELFGCDDGSVWLWDVGSQNDKPKVMLRPHITNVFTTNFLSSNRYISGANDATVQYVQLANDRAVTTSFINHHQRKVDCSFVIDENTFATCSHDRTVRLFDVRQKYSSTEIRDLPILTDDEYNYDPRERLCHDLDHYDLRPQGSGGGLRHLPSESPPDETLLLDLRSEEDSELYTINAHPIDRKKFLTSGSDGTVRLFDLRMIHSKVMGFCVNEHYNSIVSITGASFDSTGKRIAATVMGGNIHILDVDEAKEVNVWKPASRNRRGAGGFNLLSYINQDTGELDLSRLREVFEDQNREEEEERPAPKIDGEIMELKGHKNEMTVKAVNWMGDYVVTGTDDGKVYFFDPANGRIVNVLSGHKEMVNVVAVHEEKHLLSTSGVDDFAMLWEPNGIGEVDEEEIEQTIKDALKAAEDSEVGHPQACLVC